MYKVAPLPGTFMLTSILLFFISVLYVSDLSKSWGFAFTLLSLLMFIASFISMTRANAEEEVELDEKYFHGRIYE